VERNLKLGQIPPRDVAQVEKKKKEECEEKE
jgi:hypothetical protein